jgi:hypothetical protein
MGKKNRAAAMSRIPTGQRIGSASSPIGALPPYVVRVDGSGVVLDPQHFPIPDQIYDADFGWVEYRGGAFSFLFGKRDLNDETRLRSRIELRLSIDSFVNFWKYSGGDFMKRVTENLEAAPVLKEGLPGDPRLMKADRDHSDWATIVIATLAGSQGQIDFFHLPQGDMVAFEKSQDVRRLAVQTVVRIYTTPAILQNILLDASRLVQELGSKLPSRIGESP